MNETPSPAPTACAPTSDRVLAVLIPVYNEQDTITTVLARVDALPMVREIIVVDDGSTDATVARIQAFGSPRVRLIRQQVNSGKTAAIRRAVAEATSPLAIIQDADLEYDPDEIPFVVAPILEGRADVVYGSRFLVRRAARVLYFYHYLANKSLTFCSNLLTNMNMTDIETCYKAFRTPILQEVPFNSSGFGMEVEITAFVARTRARVYEVPISYYGRTYQEGKKIGMLDGLAALWYIFRYNLFSRLTPSYAQRVQAANDFLASMSPLPPAPEIPSAPQP